MNNLIELDHIVLACADRASGMSELDDLLDAPLSIGGNHPGRGTCNALGALDSNAYLELLCPDPNQQPTPLSCVLSTFTKPTLFHWAARSNALGAIAERASQLQFSPSKPIDAQRLTSDGELLKWQLLFIGGNKSNATVPFFIYWQQSMHPSTQLEKVASIAQLTIRSSNAAELSDLLNGPSTSNQWQIEHARNASISVSLQSGARTINLVTDDPISAGIVA